MPLDTGRVADLDFGSTDVSEMGLVRDLPPTLQSGANIGAALRAVREASGRSVEDVAELTCVRRAYLTAIEDMRLDQLPSRPFTVGYIRAYANALGLDGEAAVERFKRDEPAPDQALREPLGVNSGPDPRLALAGVAGAVIVAAILAWNVAQRVTTESTARQAPAAAASNAVVLRPASVKPAPLAVGAPLPPPVESTTPELYETPGLQAATAADGSANAAEAAAKLAKANKASQPAAPPPDLPATFVSTGAVFGAAADSSVVTLQARKAASIIIRGPDGSVYFARQLAAGEAYRAPTMKGLTVDVSTPDSFQVFVSGQTKGLLPAAQTPLSKLEG